MYRRLMRGIAVAGTLIVVSVLALAGCSSAGRTNAAQGHGSKPRVGYLVYDIGLDPWMNAFQSTLEKQAANQGIDLTVANGNNDVSQMSGIIDQFITLQMDAILVAAPDPNSLVSPIQRAAAANIPVFASAFPISAESGIVSYIGSDNVELGRMQGELVVKALGGKGNVALQVGQLGNGAQIDRTKGIHEVLAKHPDIKIIEEQPSDWQADKSIALVQDWLSKYPKGEINAIVAQGPELVGGAELARSRGYNDIKFITLDYPQDVRQAIHSGTVYATLDQQPSLIATESINAVVSRLAGKPVDKWVKPQVQVVDSTNVESVPAAY